ncbi:hypothetical protein OB2597_19751 [Pseudooceanicola batsensis HTCC2597]|uniref:Uncharacterized protein n=1 Tax=Pseudooceanicola batsensis (strain ATCC BAA-863 / DSM 15984 / KCTC 12145 / HTCC2597) TaxID=252305 RepID=A3U0R0_PSEBH|nr:hypothetical protein OB2597_19751 [Pseudooceanicola batsensis HTCC2597]
MSDFSVTAAVAPGLTRGPAADAPAVGLGVPDQVRDTRRAPGMPRGLPVPSFTTSTPEARA